MPDDVATPPDPPPLPAPDTEGATTSPRHLRRWLWLGVAASVGALAGGVLVVALTFEPAALDELDRIGPSLALGLLGLVAAAWTAAAVRLVLLTRALGHPVRPRHAAVTAVAAEFGSAASPAGLGSVAVRIGLLRSYDVPLAESAAVAGADFAVELVAGTGLTLVALLLVLRPGPREIFSELGRQGVGTGSLVLLAALAVLVAAGLVLRRLHRRAAAAREPGTGAAGERHGVAALWRRGALALDRVRVQLAALRRHPRTLALCLLLAGGQIAARYSVLPVLAWALTGEAQPFALFLFQGAVMAVSQALVAPGGGGGVEIGAGALMPLFVPDHLSGVVVLLWRLFTYHLSLVVGGGVFFAWMAVRGRRLRRPLASAAPDHSPGTGNPRSRISAPTSASRPRKAR